MLNSTSVIRLNFGTELNISPSISVTSPSCKPLVVSVIDHSRMLEDLNAGKVMGKGVSKLYSWYRGKRIINRFRGVTDIWNLFDNPPILREQITEYERLFNVALDGSELDRLQNKMKGLDPMKKENDCY